jgi:hypothetical protein
VMETGTRARCMDGYNATSGKDVQGSIDPVGESA